MPGRHLPFLICMMIVLAGTGAAVSFPVDSAADWNAGTHTNTTGAGGTLALVGTNATGSYVSETFDAGDEYAWASLDVDSALNGGSVNVSVATSNDSFATVQERSTFSLSGGGESFDLSSFAESQYIRFNYSLVRGSSSPTVSATNVTLGGTTHFLIRDEACQADEEELFSLSNRSNAHAADPGYYNYKMCASGINGSDYDSVCTNVETPTLSFFGSRQNYTHLSTEDELFDYKLCTGQLSIGIRNECPPTTKAIVSIYNLPESHIGEPGVYQHQLCGAVFKEVSLLMEFHLGADDDVYLNGQENPAQGVYRDVDDPSYISAENASLVAGIVSSEGTTTEAVGYLEEGGDHVFNVTQQRGVVGYLIPFTTGDRFSLESRLPMIEDGTFLEQFGPSFGFAMAERAAVQLTLQLTGIDLITDLSLATGVHRLVIRNVGTNSAGEPRVSVNVTAR